MIHADVAPCDADRRTQRAIEPRRPALRDVTNLAWA